MSFKLDDYNAFLTSLYEKDPNSKQTTQQQSSNMFPVDFNFGLEVGAGEQKYPIRIEDVSPSAHVSENTPEFGDERRIPRTNEPNPQMYNDPGEFDSTWYRQPALVPFEETSNATTEETIARPRAKSSHNVIEQRYRNKINDKFTILQDTVPSLRLAKRRLKGSTTSNGKQEHEEELVDVENISENEDLEGLEPARKLNKGTILTKSIEYIKFLEMKNHTMQNEHEQLLLQAKMLGIPIDEVLNTRI